HERVVEGPLVEALALSLAKLRPQRQDLVLAHGVGVVARPEDAAARLALGDDARGEAFAHEELDAVVDAPAFDVHPERAAVAAEPEQRLRSCMSSNRGSPP